MTRKHWLLASLPLLVGGLATACGDDTSSTTDTDSDGSTSTSTTTTTTTTTTTSASSSTTTTTTTTTTTDPTTSTTDATDSATTGPPPPDEAEFIVTIENISTDTWYPTDFSPVVWVEHELGSQPMFAVNGTASAGLIELAEDGVTGTLVTEMEAINEVVSAGAYDVPETAGGMGPIAPGDSYVFNVTAQQGSRLSLASMLYESNDIFLGTGPNGVSLFTNSGFPEDERDVTLNLEFWEAGSEANQAPPGGAYMASQQSAAGEGPDESGAVSLRSESTHQIPQAARLVDTEVVYNMDNGEFTITISNLDDAIATEWGALVYAMHNDTQSLFTEGMTADNFAGLEAVVEDGDATAMITDITGNVDQQGSTTDVAAGGQFVVTLVPAATDPMFSFVAGLSETNDAFIGNATGVALLDDMGNPRPTGDIEEDFDSLIWLYDAGSEANETPGAGANQRARQANAGDGTAETNPIALYSDTTNDLADITTALDIVVENNMGGGDSHTVTITNNSDTTAYPFTIAPVPWIVHDGTVSAFTAGMPASASLELLAEDGDNTGVDGDFTTAVGGATASSNGIQDGTTTPLAPGDSVTFTVDATETFSSLTFVTQVSPSNDTFVAFELDLFNGATALTDGELAAAIAGAVGVYDAGTEYNQVGAAGRDQHPRQADVNTGANEGDGTIQAANDKDPVWLYPDPTEIVRVTIAPVEQ